MVRHLSSASRDELNALHAEADEAIRHFTTDRSAPAAGDTPTGSAARARLASWRELKKLIAHEINTRHETLPADPTSTRTVTRPSRERPGSATTTEGETIMAGKFDKAKGTAEEKLGQAKRKIGDATDNRSLQAEGVKDEAKGNIHQAEGEVKDRLDHDTRDDAADRD